jgi:hypothetical protein
MTLISLSNNGRSPAFEAEDGGSIPSKLAMNLKLYVFLKHLKERFYRLLKEIESEE